MAGESSNEENTLEALSAELEFTAFGMGVSHMAALPDACPRCNDTGTVGPELLPLPCPLCHPVDWMTHG